MIRIRTMSCPTVGDVYVGHADHGVLGVFCDCQGMPIADRPDYPHAEVGTFPVRVTRVGSYWSNQPSGTSGWYVELERV